MGHRAPRGTAAPVGAQLKLRCGSRCVREGDRVVGRARHLYLPGALRARALLARSALWGGGEKVWKIEENNFQNWDFVFWRDARQGAAGAQRASYGAGGLKNRELSNAIEGEGGGIRGGNR